MSRSGLECEELETLCVKDHTLNNESMLTPLLWSIIVCEVLWGTNYWKTYENRCREDYWMGSKPSFYAECQIWLGSEGCFVYWEVFLKCWLHQFHYDLHLISARWYMPDYLFKPGSIKHGISILQAIQNESKSAKKSLKVASKYYWADVFHIYIDVEITGNIWSNVQYWICLVQPGCCYREWIWEETSSRCDTAQWHWSDLWWYWSSWKCQGYAKGTGDAASTKARTILQGAID